MKNSNPISNLLSDPEAKYLCALYTIQGVYGEVDFVTTYDIKNGKIHGVSNLEKLYKPSKMSRLISIFRGTNASTSRFSVRFRTDISEKYLVKHDIVGLPIGINHSMYFNMAQVKNTGIKSKFI